MQSASQLAFPGSRTLAQWWRQLQPIHPRAGWVGHLYLHRLEAPVHTARQFPLDPLAQLLLQAVTLEPAAGPCRGPGTCLQRLQQRLHLPSSVLHQILAHLQQDALVQGQPGGCWTATERGRQAQQQLEFPVERQERRVFPFVERLDDQGQRLLPPHYVPIAECPATPWQVGDADFLDPAALPQSIHQPASWKQEFCFPADVIEAGAAPTSWRQVIVDRPEHVLLMLTLCGNAEIVGFAVHQESWALVDTPAVLRLPLAAAQTLWPVLGHEPDTGLLREAWLGWCRQRSLPLGEAEASELSYHTGRLDVRAPERLVHRLRSARSDVFKGDSWLLLGTGHLRPAVVLQVHSRSRAETESR